MEGHQKSGVFAGFLNFCNLNSTAKLKPTRRDSAECMPGYRTNAALPGRPERRKEAQALHVAAAQ